MPWSTWLTTNLQKFQQCVLVLVLFALASVLCAPIWLCTGLIYLCFITGQEQHCSGLQLCYLAFSTAYLLCGHSKGWRDGLYKHCGFLELLCVNPRTKSYSILTHYVALFFNSLPFHAGPRQLWVSLKEWLSSLMVTTLGRYLPLRSSWKIICVNLQAGGFRDFAAWFSALAKGHGLNHYSYS